MAEHESQGLFQHLLVFILSLAAPCILFVFRHLDDNRLTSWNWAFNRDNLDQLLLILSAALAFAWLASRVSFSKKSKAPALFIISFATAACFWSEPEVIVDAARYFAQAKHLKVYGVGYFADQWGESIFAWTDLPLVPFLYGLVFKFLGEHRILIQALNTTFFSLTVVLTYQLGRILWDEETGFWGAILLLGFPYLYTQVPLMLVDVPTLFFFMLAVVTCVNGLQKGGMGRIVFASFSLLLIFYVKYSSWVLLTVIPVIYAYFLFRSPGVTVKRGGLVVLFSSILIGTIFLLYHDLFLNQIDFLMEYQKPGLKRWSESYASTFFFQIHPFITAAALFSFIVAARKMDFRFVIICFLFLLFLFMQVKRIRYTLPIFPMFSLMAAYGLGVLQNTRLKKHLVLSIVVTAFVVAFTGFLPLLKSLGVQNLQNAGRYLNSLPGESAEVITFAAENQVVNPEMGVPILDIYTGKSLYYENRPKSRKTLEQVRNASLRFTWEFPVPPFYSKKNEQTADALVVISDSPTAPKPDVFDLKTGEYSSRKFFHRSSYIFQHQTFVTVYHK